MTFIAIDDADSPVGSVALVAHDMPDRTDLRHLSPWVAGTLSSAASEAKGIGKMLMRHAVAEADRVGAGELFLYASTARSFYERLGWTLLREDFYDGEPVAIMALRS